MVLPLLVPEHWYRDTKMKNSGSMLLVMYCTHTQEYSCTRPESALFV